MWCIGVWLVGVFASGSMACWVVGVVCWCVACCVVWWVGVLCGVVDCGGLFVLVWFGVMQ